MKPKLHQIHSKQHIYALSIEQNLFRIQEKDTTILSEYIFRLLGKHYQLLFK